MTATMFAWRMSPRGSLRFDRRVRFSSEGLACALAGEALSPECEVVAAWREALAQSRDGGMTPTGLVYFRAALAVRRLRAEMRKEPSRVFVVPVEGQDGDVEPHSGRPGVLLVISGRSCLSRRDETSLDVNVAVHDIMKRGGRGYSDGITFGAIGVRLLNGAGRVVGLVVWDNNRGAIDLYHLTEHWPRVGDDRLGKTAFVRYVRRALRREARRMLNAARALLAKRAQRQQAQPAVNGDGQANASETPAE